MGALVYGCIGVCVYVYMDVWVYAYIYIYIYIYNVYVQLCLVGGTKHCAKYVPQKEVPRHRGHGPGGATDKRPNR